VPFAGIGSTALEDDGWGSNGSDECQRRKMTQRFFPAIILEWQCSQCRQMALDIIKLYISLLSEFFILSELLSNSSTSTIPTSPVAFELTNDGSLAWQDLCEVQECVTEISALELGEAECERTGRERAVGVLRMYVRFWIRGMCY